MAKKKSSENQIAILEKMISDKNPPIDLRALSEEWVRQIGGIKGLVKNFIEEWNAAKPGGQTRARLMQLQTRLIDLTTRKDNSGDLEHLEEADLVRLVASMTSRVESGQEEQPAGLDKPAISGGSGPANPA